jgi:2-hydroxy-3-keto-5-methylthiopentenyl-1-phosphate phosphatase
MTENKYDWEAEWRATLAGMPTKLWLTDLDGTKWQDILVRLNEQFGPVDPETQLKKWLQYDHAYKVAKTMTNGAHLVAEYQDLLAEHTLDELIAWVKAEVKLIPGTLEFDDMLTSAGVGIVAISNGARQLAQPKLEHHKLPYRLICNWFEGTTLKFVHNEHVGIDKGVLVQCARDWGHEIVGFSGDAIGDVNGAGVAARHGGLVLACDEGGLADWCRKTLQPEQWLIYTDFRDVMKHPALQARIGGN